MENLLVSNGQVTNHVHGVVSQNVEPLQGTVGEDVLEVVGH